MYQESVQYLLNSHISHEMSQKHIPLTVADPEFPVGGAPTRWGDTDLRHIHFSAKTYAKTKEMDPVGGARAGGAPPGSANASLHSTELKLILRYVPFEYCGNRIWLTNYLSKYTIL